MEQIMDTMRDAGSRVLAALCETGKAVAGFVTGVVKSVSCAVAGFVKDGTCKAAGCTWSKVKQFVKDNRQVLLIVAAGVSAALTALAAISFFLGRKKSNNTKQGHFPPLLFLRIRIGWR